MAGFPMIETGYKPMFELGGVFAGENAANASAGAVQQLIQQAFENQVAPELHQETMDNKRAQSEWYRAQAERAAREDTDKYADKIAKAQDLKLLETNRSDRTMLENALSMADAGAGDYNTYLDELITSGKISPNVIQGLRPTADVNLYTKDNLRRIINNLRETDPQTNKLINTNIKEDSATERKRLEIESKERIAQWQTENKRQLAELKAKNDKATLNQRAAQYLDAYNKATTESEKLAFYEMYVTAKDAAAEVSAAAATQGATAKAKEDRKKLLLLLKGRGVKLSPQEEAELSELSRSTSGKIGEKKELTTQEKRNQL